MSFPITAPLVRHLIVDRDGVLNREAPDGGWITSPREWTWEEGALDGLRLAARHGVFVSVVTNQSVIGRGIATAEAVEAVHRHMVEDARAAGGRIDAVYTCPHAPDGGCDCRKPRPGLVLHAITTAGLPPTATILVGDAVRDVEAARAAGIRAVLVRTGKGRRAEAELGDSGVAAFDGLADAVAATRCADVDDSGPATGELEGWISQRFADHRAVLDATASAVPTALGDVIAASASCLGAGGKILICGNGGSAADAQHLAAELVCRFRTDRRALPAIALHTDTSAITAIANDLGYETVFARQVEALARPGDLLIAISTSGRSPNVIQAARTARERGCTVVAMTGRDGRDLGAHAHYQLTIPADEVAHIQEMHAICIHALADALERHAMTEKDTP